MRPRRRLILLGVVLVIAGGGYSAVPYTRAASLIARVAHTGGRMEAFANGHARAVTVEAPHAVSTRHGEVPAQFYRPDGEFGRSVLLVPGIHSMGITEPRLTSLARELAASGVMVMTMALPDLQRYRISPAATDVIEDAVAWMARRDDLAPDGRVGLIGISFAGGLAISAAGRPAIRNQVAFVLSFGGHGDLPRVMRYLATGEEPEVAGLAAHPPHDYGVAVILDGLADRGVVPADQVAGLRSGVEMYLLASQLTLVDMSRANAMYARARELAGTLPEPSASYLAYVNDRAVDKLGPVLVPYLSQLGADDPALSPARAEHPPAAPVYLLHGADDTVIPAAESALLAEHLRREGVDVHLLLSGLITHAEVDRNATASDTWELISFWASVLRQ